MAESLRGADVLFSRNRRRQGLASIVDARVRAATAALDRGDPRPALHLVGGSGIDEDSREALLGELAEHALVPLYDDLETKPDPSHPEHELVRRELRSRISERPDEESIRSAQRRLPSGIWDCRPLGPLARALVEALDIDFPKAAHVTALAERPDSPLGERVCGEILGRIRWSTGQALELLGLDGGFHRHLIRFVPEQMTLHILRRGELPVEPVHPVSLCLHRNLHQQVCRDEITGRLEDDPRLCSLCKRDAQRQGIPFEDPRPYRSPLAGHEERLEGLLRSSLVRVVAGRPLSRGSQPGLLRLLLDDEETHLALSEELCKLFTARLDAERPALADVPGLGMVHGLEDVPLIEVLGSEGVRDLAEGFALSLSAGGITCRLRRRLARGEGRKTVGRRG